MEDTMPSPFPGMNPYLEQDDVWHDFHERLIPSVAELLEAGVGPNYIVKIDEQVYVHELPQGERSLLGRSDVFLARSAAGGERAGSTALLQAPATVRVPAFDMESLSFVEIRDRSSREVVTAIEILSPANKRPGPDREQYLAKRARFLASPAHFVEIDLLRGGPRMPFEELLPPCDYYILVSRVEDRPSSGLWPIRLRSELPVVPVPLRKPDKDAPLDLKRALDRVHDAAGYAKYIYAGRPGPDLAAEDGEWAKKVLGPLP
jgi:hypothetical protein